MATKLALAMRANVTVFTRSKDKVASIAQLGARAVIETDQDTLKTLKNHFDFILDTIPQKHDVNPFVTMLKRDCTLVVVGAIEPLAPENNQERIMHRKSVAGSLIGSIAETQAVLDFCAEHKIGPDVQVIPIQNINDAFRKVEHDDVRFRYVIDMSSLQQDMA